MTLPRLRALRGLAKGFTAPVIAQGITAATSLLLQVVAAHSLGLSEFGMFAIFLALLWTAVGLYGGYVGDGLTVLDRHEPRIRSALVSSALVAATLFAAIGAGVVLALRRGDPQLATVYAGMIVVWLLRETLRRLLIARLTFRTLVVNDCLYLAVVVGTLLAFHLTAGISMVALFGTMGIGAVAAIALGVAVLPRHELAGLRPRLSGMRELASFATWRAAQATLRPASMLLVRVLVAHILSFAAAGLLEAARLVVAAIQVVLNGAAGYLIASFAAAERAGRLTAGHLTARTAWLLLAVTVGLGGPLALFAEPVGRLITGNPVDPLLALGWVVYLTVWAFGLPYGSECTARQLSRALFTARLVDSAAGLGLTAIALLAGAAVVVVPWLMALAGMYSVWRMHALAIATRPTVPPR